MSALVESPWWRRGRLLRPISTVFLVSVARSAIRVWKLWTGRPSGVRPVATAPGNPFTITARPTPIQKKALELLDSARTQ